MKRLDVMAGLIVLFTISLGLILPNFVNKDINDKMIEDNGQCHFRVFPYDQTTRIKYLTGYTLIKITDSKYPYFVFAKNCDNQIRIHSDFIMKKEKE